MPPSLGRRIQAASAVAQQQAGHILQEAFPTEAGLLHLCCKPTQLCAGCFSQQALVGAPACRRHGGAGGSVVRVTERQHRLLKASMAAQHFTNEKERFSCRMQVCKDEVPSQHPLACPRCAVQQLKEQGAVGVGAQVGPGLGAVRDLQQEHQVKTAALVGLGQYSEAAPGARQLGFRAVCVAAGICQPMVGCSHEG